MRPHGLIAQLGFQRIRYLCISTSSSCQRDTHEIQSAKKTDPAQLNYQEEMINEKAGLENVKEDLNHPVSLEDKQR